MVGRSCERGTGEEMRRNERRVVGGRGGGKGIGRGIGIRVQSNAMAYKRSLRAAL
jgi:hypothetical protein